MSKLLIQWVNADVGLSREVASLDADFRDGYLLGELLSKYKQQSDFSLFSPKGTNDAKINNFKRIEPTMRTLGIFFNSRVANDIMEGKTGVMKTLLFELKTTLDSYHRGVRRPTEKKLVQVIAVEKPKYNKTMAETFDNAIRSSITKHAGRSQSAGNRDDVECKTDAFHVSLEEGHAEDMQEFVSDIQRAKQISQQKKLHEKEFMKAWDEKNVTQWKSNLARGKARREKEQNDLLTRTRTIQHARAAINEEHRESTLVGIGEFEETLKREMLKNDDTENISAASSSLFKTAGGQPGTGIPALTYMNPDTLRDGLVQTQKTLKERHDDMVVRQQAHTRRRKRYVREKEARQVKSLSTAVEGDIADQLLSMNKSEDVERLARSRVLIHADLMRENARNRVTRAAALTAEFTEKEVTWKQLQATREIQWVIKPRIEAQAERLTTLMEASTSATSCDTHDFISSIVDRVLDVTDWVVCCRLLGTFQTEDGFPLPGNLWSDAMAMHSENSLTIPAALPRPEPCNVFGNLPFSLCTRPLCSEQKWLTSSPFTGRAIMTLDAEAGDDHITIALAKQDSAAFISKIAAAELPGAETVITSVEPAFNDLSPPPDDPKDAKAAKAGKKGAKEEAPVEEEQLVPPIIGKTKTLVENPEWLFKVPVKNLLGGVVVECRNVTAPLPLLPVIGVDESEEKEFNPDPPAPVILRIALCGPTDSLKRKIAAEISRQLAPADVATICVHDLVQMLSVVETDSECTVMGGLVEETAEQLRKLIFADVLEGGLISDSTYVKIAAAAISSLPPTTGYILEDFPNTKEQARLLLLSLTGVDRAQKRPQPNDKATVYLPVKEAEFLDFDKALSVFDAVIHVNPVNMADPVDYRVRCRKNLRDGSTVVVCDDCPSVEALSDQFTPDMPHELLSVSLKLAAIELEPLVSFLDELGVLQRSDVASYHESDIEAATKTVLATFQKEDTKVEVQGGIEEEVPVAEKEAVPVEEAGEAVAAAEEKSALPEESASPAAPEIIVKRIVGTVHNQVAKALMALWDAAEHQSSDETASFFETVRDVRYRLVQRRRCIIDILAKSYIRRDTKQLLWDEFVSNFNSFDDDFRYDEDLKAELHLRALELRAEFWFLAEKRKQEIEASRVKVLADGALAVAIHAIQGSAAALVQSEVNRFKTGMNIAQDYLNSAAAYKYSNTAVPTLEECAVPPENLYDSSISGASLGAVVGKDGKPAAKAKGGKGDVKPLRNPVAPILLNKDSMLALPEPVPFQDKPDEATAAKGKAAAKPKGGKGAAETPDVLSPFDSVEKSAVALAEYYSQGNFTAPRELYQGNECIVDVLENIIWHEAERLKFSVARIKEIIVDVGQWLSKYEKEAGELAEKFIYQNYLRELACAQAVVARVIRAVEDFSPIREEWLLGNDAFSVMSQNLVVALPEESPIPIITDFPQTRFNDEQLRVVEDALSRLQLGGLVLLEDIDAWLQKSSLPGAIPGNTFSCVGSNGFEEHITNLHLPDAVIRNQDQVSVALRTEMLKTPFSESGVCPASLILKVMSELNIVTAEDVVSVVEDTVADISHQEIVTSDEVPGNEQVSEAVPLSNGEESATEAVPVKQNEEGVENSTATD